MEVEVVNEAPSYFTRYKIVVFLSTYCLLTVPVGIFCFMKKERCWSIAVIL